MGGVGGGCTWYAGSSGYFRCQEIGPLSGTINTSTSVGTGGQRGRSKFYILHRMQEEMKEAEITVSVPGHRTVTTQGGGGSRNKNGADRQRRILRIWLR